MWTKTFHKLNNIFASRPDRSIALATKQQEKKLPPKSFLTIVHSKSKQKQLTSWGRDFALSTVYLVPGPVLAPSGAEKYSIVLYK